MKEAGGMKELENLYREIHPKVYAFFYVKTGSQSVAEDLTQDTFYEAMKSYHSFRKQASIKTWVFSIARNLLYKYYRSNKYKKHLEKRLVLAHDHPLLLEDAYLLKEESTLLLKCIESLDELRREIVTLRVFGELSFKEIGELVGKSENYARVHFHRAKLQLQKRMEGDDEKSMPNR